MGDQQRPAAQPRQLVQGGQPPRLTRSRRGGSGDDLLDLDMAAPAAAVIGTRSGRPHTYGLPSWLLANATARPAALEGAPARVAALAARAAASRRSRARRRSASWRRRSSATARRTCLVRRWW